MLPERTATQAEDLRRWLREFPDVTPIGETQARQRADCVGIIHKIRVVPGESLELTVIDGTGKLVAAWRGRTTLPGLELGAGLRLSGTVSVGADDVRRMLHPAWALIRQPYA